MTESHQINRKNVSSKSATSTKSGLLIKLLKSKHGVSLAQLQEASGWQAHSVRGFLSGTVRKKLGLNLEPVVGRNGSRRYRIIG